MKEKLDKLFIHDYYYVHTINGDYPLRFIPADNYYPLVNVPAMYKGYNNPYFDGIESKGVHCRMTRMNLVSSGHSFRYRKNRNWTGPKPNLYTGMLTAMGLQDDFDYMPSSLFDLERKYKMVGELDVFCLGVVKTSHLPQVDFKSNVRHNRRSVDINIHAPSVKILVSTEKLRKTLFTKTHYTGTVRRTILDEIRMIEDKYKIVVEDVSEDYIEKFMIRPHTVRTNSVVKIIEMDTEIKNSVFSNLNEKVV